MNHAALWVSAAASACLAALAAFADRKRSRRSDLDRVGWAPWPLLLVLALLAAATLTGLALAH
jgi:hypothetical protein